VRLPGGVDITRTVEAGYPVLDTVLRQVLVPTRPARQLAQEVRVVVRADEARTQLRRSGLATGGVPPNEHAEDHSKQEDEDRHPIRVTAARMIPPPDG
jgi:hypothetical protein